MNDTRNSPFPTLAEVRASKIMAKAVIQRADGKVVIMTVNQLSYEYAFYFFFEAKSPRSPRRSWKALHYWTLYQNKYLSFEEAIDRYMITYPGQAIKKTFPIGRKAFGKIMEKALNRTFDRPVNPPAGSNTYVQSKHDRKRRGRIGGGNSIWRNRI